MPYGDYPADRRSASRSRRNAYPEHQRSRASSHSRHHHAHRNDRDYARAPSYDQRQPRRQQKRPRHSSHSSSDANDPPPRRFYCYHCGLPGHWANSCPARLPQPNPTSTMTLDDVYDVVTKINRTVQTLLARVDTLSAQVQQTQPRPQKCPACQLDPTRFDYCPKTGTLHFPLPQQAHAPTPTPPTPAPTPPIVATPNTATPSLPDDRTNDEEDTRSTRGASTSRPRTTKQHVGYLARRRAFRPPTDLPQPLKEVAEFMDAIQPEGSTVAPHIDLHRYEEGTYDPLSYDTLYAKLSTLDNPTLKKFKDDLKYMTEQDPLVDHKFTVALQTLTSSAPPHVLDNGHFHTMRSHPAALAFRVLAAGLNWIK
eukprot:Sspe_Gene.45418::Locus_22487_Transcript_1_1_Confidence_1.000_Length_1319::g.45418::m.45418